MHAAAAARKKNPRRSDRASLNGESAEDPPSTGRRRFTPTDPPVVAPGYSGSIVSDGRYGFLPRGVELHARSTARPRILPSRSRW